MSKLDSAGLIALIRQGLAGSGTMVPGPFGQRPLLYADYTASGRSLDFIEAAMAQMVLPHYANTHTETSYTGLQTTRFREQARGVIRAGVGADERHAVIFCGSGATAAINKLVSVMGLRRALPEGAPRPVVFVGPYEHHSNDLIWRESAVTLVRIPLDDDGQLCMGTLEAELEKHAEAPLKIGSFSAASNVTGVRTDMGRLGEMLGRHGARFFADYAAAGPYLDIDMVRDRIDAIFMSPHKFVGGPGASGVLVAERGLLASAVPSVPGGGTVAYVSSSMHRYVSDAERREEAGTPAILGDIRAGMAMQLKSDIGAEAIEAREKRAIERAFAAWRQEPNVEVLGPQGAERLAIFSLNIAHKGRHLHPNFVVALLNDLFGIQARGGCSCAGPYGHDLLGISDAKAAQYDALLREGLNIYRPGWVRLNFNFFLDEAEIDAIIAAVRFIARRGGDLLALYECDPATGRWRANGQQTEPKFGFADLCAWGEAPAAGGQEDPLPFAHYLAEAERLADGASGIGCMPLAGMQRDERWFAMAGDAA